MSVVKSSVINLYDSLTGSKHFQTKVSSDRVDLQVSTLPLYLKGTTVNLCNEGGNVVLDVVESMLATDASVVAESVSRASAISAEAKSRSDADLVVQSAVDKEVTDRISAMVAETILRVAVEGALDVKITEEKSARQSAITAEISARSVQIKHFKPI